MLATPKDWFLLTILVLFATTAFGWIVFARLTMARIEKKLTKLDTKNSFAWDGVGVRTLFYAYAIALPERYAIRLEKRLIQSSEVRRHATRGDQASALFFLISSNLFVLFCITGWIIWA